VQETCGTCQHVGPDETQSLAAADAEESRGRYFDLYDQERLHQARSYRTPAEV